MSDSFLKECGGFTPVPDALIKKYDNSDIALVWGTVWRYWQRPDKSKPPSQETMAQRAGISRRTFIEYLNQLIEDGYITDLDPGVRNRPHLYSTDKGEELIRGVQISHTDNTIQDDRCAEFAQDNDVGMRNLHTGYAEDAHQEGVGMQISHLKIEDSSNIESIPNIESKRATKSSRPHPIPAIAIHTEITGKHCLNKAQIAEIEKTVGTDPPALEKWRDSVKAWTMRGYSPTRADGMIEWFLNGIPVHQNGATKNGHYSSKRTRDYQPVSQATGLGAWTEAELAEFREAGISLTDDG